MSETNNSINGFHAKTLLESIANGEHKPCSDSIKLAAQDLLPNTDANACLDEENKTNLATILKRITELSSQFTARSEAEIERLTAEWSDLMGTARIDCQDCLSTEFCSKYQADNPEE